MDHRHGAPLFYALVHVGMEEFVFAASGRKVTKPQDPNSINKFLTKNTSRSKTLERPQNSKLPLIVEGQLYVDRAHSPI